MAKQNVKKYCMHLIYQQWTTYVILCYNMCTAAVSDSGLAYNQPIGCVGVHCNLRIELSLFIVTFLSQGIFSSLLQCGFRI
jgi:hypothetical protein